MKNMKLFSQVLVTLAFLSASAGFAADKHSGGGHSEVGLGVSSFSGAGENGAPALSGWFNLDGSNVLQPLFTVTRTSPGFGFSVGTLYKHYMSSGPTGWHLGAAFAIGTPGGANAAGNPVTLLFAGLFGLHANFPGTSNLLIQFDAGPALALVDGNANFAISPFSTMLGASLVYVF